MLKTTTLDCRRTVGKPSLTVLPSLLSEYPEDRGLRLVGHHLSRLDGNQQCRVCYTRDVPRFIPCSNSNCKGRGYFMGTIIAKLVKERETRYKGDWVCDGCQNSLQFALSLTYRQESAEDSDSEATGS